MSNTDLPFDSWEVSSKCRLPCRRSHLVLTPGLVHAGPGLKGYPLAGSLGLTFGLHFLGVPLRASQYPIPLSTPAVSVVWTSHVNIVVYVTTHLMSLSSHLFNSTNNWVLSVLPAMYIYYFMLYLRANHFYYENVKHT